MGCVGVTAAARPRERHQGSPQGVQKGGDPTSPTRCGRAGCVPSATQPFGSARGPSPRAASEIKPVTQVLPRTEREQGEEMGTFNDDCAEALG